MSPSSSSSAGASASVTSVAWLGRGEVRHERLRPTPHRFVYPTYFLMLPMRSLRTAPCAALPRNRFGLVSFHDGDHGVGGADSLAWLEALLLREGVAGADGEVWLQCYPRVLGFAFKPVSFWYCHAADGALRAVVVEVNNTFGERHCYLLDVASEAPGRELRAMKALHVSPFCAVAGDYRFRFARREAHPPAGRGRIVARVDLHDAFGPLIRTSLSGELQHLTRASLRAAFFGMPLMTLGVVARIHWQAWKLWRKKVPFFAKPAAPPTFTTR